MYKLVFSTYAAGFPYHFLFSSPLLYDMITPMFKIPKYVILHLKAYKSQCFYSL